MLSFTIRSVQRAVALVLLGLLNLYAQPAPNSDPSLSNRMRVEPGPHQRVWQIVTDRIGVPIIAMSGHPDEIRNLERSGKPHLIKPFGVATLLSGIESVLATTRTL